ncbi:MAG: hypothetical protein JWL83_1082 [Actinomycetia bacterium]|nr:hypothetical protein [Actinomycetes bacterium]
MGRSPRRLSLRVVKFFAPGAECSFGWGARRCNLQITGIQPVGGARFGAVSAVVVDDKPVLPSATAKEAGGAAQRAARASEAETVVFPRRGALVDQRPDAMKRARAVAKYREQGAAEPRRQRSG